MRQLSSRKNGLKRNIVWTTRSIALSTLFVLALGVCYCCRYSNNNCQTNFQWSFQTTILQPTSQLYKANQQPKQQLPHRPQDKANIHKPKKSTPLSSSSSSTSSTTLTNTSIVFPLIHQTLEFATLSRVAYKLHHQEMYYRYNETALCEAFNDPTNALRRKFNLSKTFSCEWYHHNKAYGTKVLLLSNSYPSPYLMVVFVGTDDVKTFLDDVDFDMVPFGTPNNNDTNSTHNASAIVRLVDPSIQVHEGFNSAIFADADVWDEILTRVQTFLKHQPQDNDPPIPVYVTGHSLGAANAIFTTVALSLKGIPGIICISFGCPRTGNSQWKEFVKNLTLGEYPPTATTTTSSSTTTDNTTRIRNPPPSIWRVVLGWDMVPRLPESSHTAFYHVGHTVQLWTNKTSKKKTRRSSEDNNNTSDSPFLTLAYYYHYGDNSSLNNYSGVPPQWFYKPSDSIFKPGSISSHFSSHYIQELQNRIDASKWISRFQTTTDEPYPPPPTPTPPKNDDDDWTPPYAAPITQMQFGNPNFWNE